MRSEGYGTWSLCVSVCVCLSVCPFRQSAIPGYKDIAFFLKLFCCKIERFLLTAEKSAIYFCRRIYIYTCVHTFTRNPYACVYILLRGSMRVTPHSHTVLLALVEERQEFGSLCQIFRL